VTLSVNRIETAGVRFIGWPYDRANHLYCRKIV